MNSGLVTCVFVFEQCRKGISFQGQNSFCLAYVSGHNFTLCRTDASAVWEHRCRLHQQARS